MGDGARKARKVRYTHVIRESFGPELMILLSPSTLREILETTQTMKEQGSVGQAWNADKNAAELKRLRRKLDDTVESVTVSTHVT
jgi:hypothetical protein